MSEYQYYEFQAIDRPLTKQEMSEVRSLTTRATITPTRFVNVYHWGNFKGDPLDLMERYYDAFLYMANWGSHQLMLRLPRGVLDQETASRYCVEEEAFCMHVTGEHIILTFDSETDDVEEWEELEEDEDSLAALVPLRADIAAGDLRSLYLGWLLCVQEEVLHNSVVEPPVPPGLGDLSGPLHALVEFLRIDSDLLEAAAERSSATLKISPSLDEARQWLHSLSESEKEVLLLRLACEGVQPLQSEVRRRIHELRPVEDNSRGIGQGRTVGQLLAEADRKRQERERREALERARRQQEEAAARAAYLDSLVGREEEVWHRIEILVEIKQQAEYAQAVRLLTDLRDLAEREQKAVDFEARLIDLRARNSRKISFLDRLNQAGLRPAQATR